MLLSASIRAYAGHGEEPVQTISMERVKFLLDNKEKIFFVDLRTPRSSNKNVCLGRVRFQLPNWKNA